jgi:soluble lytic murein transglycosylase
MWGMPMSKRRSLKWGVALLGVAGCVTIAYSCGSNTTTGHGIATPLDAHAVGLGSEVSGRTPPRQLGEQSVVDLTEFTPLLALPEFELVSEALDGEHPETAYTKYQQVLGRELREVASGPIYQFQLGKLATEAEDHRAAAKAFQSCAEPDWALRDYCAYFAARALVRHGDPNAAFTLLGKRATTAAPLQTWWTALAGEAAFHAGQYAEAVGALQRVIEQDGGSPDSSRRALLLADAVIAGVRTKASSVAPSAVAASAVAPSAVVPNAAVPIGGGATAALDGATQQRVLTALRAVRRVSLKNAGTKLAQEAAPREVALLALLPPDVFRENQPLTIDDQFVRVAALVEEEKFEDAKLAADELLDNVSPANAHSAAVCEVRLLRNKALAGLKEWGSAADALAQLATKCSDKDLKARALFLGGKYARYDKRWSQSARLFKELEDTCPESRLADDARLLRADAHVQMSDDAESTRLLTTVAEDYPQGDMVLDGVSDLALRLMTQRKWGEAAYVLERGLGLAKQADRTRDHEFAGRERYLLARSWINAGEAERGYAEFEALIKERPLSYYMQHAYARLYEVDAARAERARQAAIAAARVEPFRFQGRPEYDTPGFRRVLELLRQGQLDWAERELGSLSSGETSVAPEVLWGTALLFSRAGSAKMSHELARGRLTDWLNQWPVGEWRQAWELAFPRPYLEHADKEATRNQLPQALVYAIMREESGFDPRAQSPANAFGLMQLIEPTARHFGKELNLRISTGALLTPRVNIALGARTLASYSDRFPENRLLGIPSYNAGPGRPKRWLKELPSRDFDLWVELIPFRETRRYTKRVLASYGVYTFLYQGAETPFLFPTKVQQGEQQEVQQAL